MDDPVLVGVVEPIVSTPTGASPARSHAARRAPAPEEHSFASEEQGAEHHLVVPGKPARHADIEAVATAAAGVEDQPEKTRASAPPARCSGSLWKLSCAKWSSGRASCPPAVLAALFYFANHWRCSAGAVSSQDRRAFVGMRSCTFRSAAWTLALLMGFVLDGRPGSLI
jgi:hypothetical protein